MESAKAGFLIDMDGVVYKGSQAVPGAIETINAMVEKNIPFIFVTNNSQKTGRDIAHKLIQMGMNVNEKHVFTCADATAKFLNRQKSNGTAYVIGEQGLTTALHGAGYSIVENNPDYVVVGEGRNLNFESLEKATKLVMNGARLIATNPDTSAPIEEGIRPGCGAIVSIIEKATGKEAFSVGKPNGVMMRLARKQLDLRTGETYMIGDTMYTDVLGGVQMGYTTILVLSGGTKTEDLDSYAYRPKHIIESIAKLPELLPEIFS